MPHLLVFGLGYTAARLVGRLGDGWRVTATRRAADAEALAFDDETRVRAGIATATHILSSVPPDGGRDPVLDRYGAALGAAPARWLGYLSSTGVYGDAGGAWVDESAPVGGGRRTARAAADLAWQALREDVRVFRLPGIYGPGRSALDAVRAGRAHRVRLPGHLFSRIHADDIAAGLVASFERGPAGVYNLADALPAPQADVVAYARDLLGLARLPDTPLDELPPAARAFYAESRRVANRKARRLLGWAPRYPDFRSGLRALSATNSPASTSNPPSAASQVQR